jgi:hypothetical protein
LSPGSHQVRLALRRYLQVFGGVATPARARLAVFMHQQFSDDPAYRYSPCS